MLIIKKPKWYTIIIHFHFVKSLLLCVCRCAIYHLKSFFFCSDFFIAEIHALACSLTLFRMCVCVCITIKTAYKNESLNGQYCIFICCSCKAAHKHWELNRMTDTGNKSTHECTRSKRRTMGHAAENMDQRNDNVSNGFRCVFFFVVPWK